MKPIIVIIGYGFATRLGLIRSLAQVSDDIRVVMIEHEKERPIDSYSKYVKHFYPCGNDETRLMRIIKEECSDTTRDVILIPTNDFSATMLDKNIEELNGHFLFPHIRHEAGAISGWMNKERQKDLAKKSGLNVAHSTNVDIVNGMFDLPSGINYPCFTKTRSCVTTGYKHTLRRCDNEKELCAFLHNLSKRFPNITIMVEDYKEIATEFAVVGCSDGKEVCIPGVIEITSMAKGIYKGIACQGKIMPVKGFEDLVAKFKRVIQEIGLVGLFDIDFYLSGSDYYFGEINLRMGGSGYSVTKMGVNLPSMFVNALMGEPTESFDSEISSTATFANERICQDNWYKGYFSTKEFKHILNSADISFVKDDEDGQPGKVFKRRTAKMRIKRFLKRCF